MTSTTQLAPQMRTRRRAHWSLAAREGVAAKIETLWQDPSYRERMMLAMKAGHMRKRLGKSLSSGIAAERMGYFFGSAQAGRPRAGALPP